MIAETSTAYEIKEGSAPEEDGIAQVEVCGIRKLVCKQVPNLQNEQHDSTRPRTAQFAPEVALAPGVPRLQTAMCQQP